MGKNFFQSTIDYGYKKYIDFQQIVIEKGFAERFSEEILKASNPEEEFLARKLLELTSKFDEIGNDVRYLHKPVRLEGTLRRQKSGWYLNDEMLTDGCKIEFMNEDKWYIGKYYFDKDARNFMILSEDGKHLWMNLESLAVRIR